MQGDITLKDLQEEIFKVIPVFLNLNDKEGYEDDSFFEAKEFIWILLFMKIFTVVSCLALTYYYIISMFELAQFTH